MYRLIFVLLLFWSCSEDCRTCVIVTESNLVEAQLHCQGLANSYPAMQVIDEENLGELCDNEIDDAIREINTSSTTEICNGVTATTRVIVRCN